jgi:hypothetical protein
MRDALELWLRSNNRPARTEEVGRKMQHLFANVREDVQRQVQRHMSAITAATNTQELQALTAESLQRMEQSGANVSGQLLRLGVAGSGSGSGVVPNYGMGTHSGGYQTMGGSHSMAGPHSMHDVNANAKGNNTLLIVIAIGFFLLAGLLIVVLGLRDRRKPDGPLADPSASPSGVVVAANTNGTGAPPDTVPGTATAAPTATEGTAPTAATVTPPPPPPTGPVATITKPAGRNPPTAPTVKGSTVGHPATTTAPEPKEDKEPGFLTIKVYPWAKVTEGGRVICAATPCIKIPLAPGTHTLQLQNAEQGVNQTTSVTIKSGETAIRDLAFK